MIRRKREPPKWLKCQFCSPRFGEAGSPRASLAESRRGEAGQSGENPDYKRVDKLCQFISDRGKIIGRTRSGVCAKHQRRLAKEIKKARYLALLPFATKV